MSQYIWTVNFKCFSVVPPLVGDMTAGVDWSWAFPFSHVESWNWLELYIYFLIIILSKNKITLNTPPPHPKFGESFPLFLFSSLSHCLLHENQLRGFGRIVVGLTSISLSRSFCEMRGKGLSKSPSTGL